MGMRAEGEPVLNLKTRGLAEDSADRLELLQQLNRQHMKPRRDQLELEARIASFELEFAGLCCHLEPQGASDRRR